MKKSLVLITIFFLFTNIIYSQAEGQPAANSAREENTVTQFDAAVSALAINIHAKLIEKKAEKITVGQFLFKDSSPHFSAYWINHLIGELTNMSGRNYTIYSGNTADADRTITGEIVQVADVIRIYTTIIHSVDRTHIIEASFYSSLSRDETINDLLSIGARADSGGSSSAPAGRDTREPDSWENPVTYSIGSSQSAPIMNRTITAGDEDFFLLVPDRDGLLTAETTGSMDTNMVLFNYDEEKELASNDDGGTETNARIVFNVRAGTKYLAVVSGYNSTTAGSYGFRSFLTIREGASSWENPASYEIGTDEKNIVTINRTFQEGDEHYYLIAAQKNGRIIIETTGRVDTFMELFDADDEDELLDENDDGGSNYNARIRYIAEAGSRYMIKVRGFSASDTGNYGFRAYYQGSGMLSADRYEPNDEPSRAAPLEIGAPLEHTFHSAEDIDWFKFQITEAGHYEILARGVNSNRLDTYIALFDTNLNLIAEDDDGGNAVSSLLSLNLNTGVYFLKVWCLDEEPDQGCRISVTEKK